MRLEKTLFLKVHFLPSYSKKDICLLYVDGLVQPPDKIVVRFTHTIYPYSLGRYLLWTKDKKGNEKESAVKTAIEMSKL